MNSDRMIKVSQKELSYLAHTPPFLPQTKGTTVQDQRVGMGRGRGRTSLSLELPLFLVKRYILPLKIVMACGDNNHCREKQGE